MRLSYELGGGVSSFLKCRGSTLEQLKIHKPRISSYKNLDQSDVSFAMNDMRICEPFHRAFKCDNYRARLD